MLKRFSLLFLIATIGSCNETGLTPENIPERPQWTESESTSEVIPVERNEPIAIAGDNQLVRPLDWVQLDGSESYDPDGFYPLSYMWSIIDVPQGSQATLQDPQSVGPRFWADLAGEYTFELIVVNADQKVSEPDYVTIIAEPAQSFYVQLSWDSISDLDLHLLNGTGPLYRRPGDCNWCNLNPEWGLPGPQDNPSLDYDTINGYGPETTTIDEPSPGDYTISIVYYGMDGFPFCTTWTCPPSLATVRLFIDGEEAYVWTRTLYDAKDVWTVARINWPSLSVTELNSMSITTLSGCSF